MGFDRFNLVFPSVTLNASAQSRLIVALDDTAVVSGANGPPKALRSGDILWRESNSSGEAFENVGSKAARLITFVLQANTPRNNMLQKCSYLPVSNSLFFDGICCASSSPTCLASLAASAS